MFGFKSDKNFTVFLYSIFDKKSGLYWQLMPFDSDVQCLRQIAATVKTSPQSELAMFPDNFAIVRLGSYCRSNGQIKNEAKVLAESLSDDVLAELYACQPIPLPCPTEKDGVDE